LKTAINFLIGGFQISEAASTKEEVMTIKIIILAVLAVALLAVLGLLVKIAWGTYFSQSRDPRRGGSLCSASRFGGQERLFRLSTEEQGKWYIQKSRSPLKPLCLGHVYPDRDRDHFPLKLKHNFVLIRKGKFIKIKKRRLK